MLTKVLTYHVLAGKFDSVAILKSVKEMGGKADMTTVEGGKITFWTKGKDLYVRDSKGKDAKVAIADVVQSNGVIHVIDHVLIP
ncbi:Fasciclin domain protein [compost metagenome]